MARRRGSKVLAYVELSEALKYGFQATESILTQYGGILGQTRYVSAAGVFFGANAPKPARATKEIASGQISSWCTSKPAGVKALKADNWSVRPSKNARGVKLGGKTRTVYASMPGGYKYAYNLVSDMVAEATGELGLVLATGAEQDLVWGSTPKPPVAAKQTGDGRRSTFCDPSESAITAASTKGWAVSSFNPTDTSGA